MARLLLTGARAPVTLELARRFAHAGHEVFVADSGPSLTEASKAVRAAYRVPAPRLEPRAFARALQAIVQQHTVDRVIPTCEEIFWLAAALEEPEFAGLRERCFCAPLETLHRLHHKGRFVSLMQSLGLRVPATTLLSSQDDLRRLKRANRTILKPVYSRFAARTRRLEPGEPLGALPRITRAQPWLAQAFIAGEEICAFAVAHAGRVTAFCAYRPGWRAGRGASASFAPLATDDPRAEQALEIVRRVVSSLGFSGQIAFDFIAESGGLTALECNPRAVSGLHLFASGDDLPRAYLEPESPPVMASGPPARLGLPMLLYALPGVLTATGRQRWLSAWRSSRDVLRDPDDPLPAGHQARVLAANLGEAWRRRCSVLKATTADIEWNGEPLEPEGPVPVQWASDSSQMAGEDWAGGFLPELMRRDSLEIAENIACDVTAIRVSDHLLPVIVPRRRDDNAYVVSPYSHYVRYARDELRELRSPALQAVAAGLLAGLGAWLRFARIDDVVFVDHGLVSTNLHPPLTLDELRAVTETVRAEYPARAVALRGVHGRDSRLPEWLIALGYRLVPSRSVLFVPTAGGAGRPGRDARRDAELLRAGPYRVRPLESPGDCARAAELYRLLYIEKYSVENPRYTPAFIELAQRTGLLEFQVLEREGQVDGVIGYYARGGYLTAPLVGYDTHLPQETGLYRMLSSLLLQTALERRLELHLSSGVAAFKRARGAESELEYTAVYTRHLPLRQRLAWTGLEWLMRGVAVPIIRERGL